MATWIMTTGCVALATGAMWLAAGRAKAGEVAMPEVVADGLEVSLFASEPQIVTPVGIAVDAAGRVFVVENHTHQRPDGYAGPESDRILVFEDRDGDGRADGSRVFADGFRNAMNLAIDEAGRLHLVHRNGVLRLEDTDGDGTCDRQVPLLTLTTDGDYPHNGLSGIAFAPDGRMFIGTGENLGRPYTATGSDGREISVVPGGANVFRMRRDGSDLELVATGMWNLFSLAVDGAGRVFGVDNDPDARPPCRLLHIVPGADFGYRYDLGRTGLHPFQAWDGELPGTLPMVAGTGEAPTGILDVRLAKLGAGRTQGMLVTEWGDCRVSLYRLAPRGATFSATAETILLGGQGFRPACLAAAPDGSVYLTDWADRAYPVHGKGRIWRLRAKDPAAGTGGEATLPVTDAERRCAQLAAADDASAWPELRAALSDADPFVRNAAGAALVRPVFRDRLAAEAAAPEPAVRLGVLLALRRTGGDDSAAAAEFLTDPDLLVRRMAVQWAAGRRWTALHDAVAAAPDGIAATPEFVRAWLAALDLLERNGPPRNAGEVSGSHDARILKILTDPDATPALQAAAIPLLSKVTPPAVVALRDLISAAEGPESLPAARAVARVAARAIAADPGEEVTAILLEAAIDQWTPPLLRLDALAEIAGRGPEAVEKLIPLLDDPEPGVVRETVRTLRSAIDHPPVREALTAVAESDDSDPEARSLAALGLGLPSPLTRPANDDQWRLTLRGKGDAEAGRRVFFSAAALCSTCHRAEGRGTAVGPDLDTIARSADRDRLIDSILEPARDVAPAYALKVVHLADGQSLTGVAAAKDGGGDLSLLTAGGVPLPAPRDRIVRVEEPGGSLMPDGLENQLTVRDFRDLLAWLLQRK